VRDREHNGVSGGEVLLYGDPVFADRIGGIGEGFVDLNGDSERPKLANDFDDLGIADVDYILFEGHSRTVTRSMRPPALSSLRRHSRATRTPIESLMRWPARITSG